MRHRNRPLHKKYSLGVQEAPGALHQPWDEARMENQQRRASGMAMSNSILSSADLVIPGLGTGLSLANSTLSGVAKDSDGYYKNDTARILDKTLNPFSRLNALAEGDLYGATGIVGELVAPWIQKKRDREREHLKKEQKALEVGQQKAAKMSTIQTDLSQAMARKGMNTQEDQQVEVEGGELLLRKKGGTYVVVHDFAGGPSHEQGGIDTMAQEGDVIIPANKAQSVREMLADNGTIRNDSLKSFEKIRSTLPKDTDYAKKGAIVSDKDPDPDPEMSEEQVEKLIEEGKLLIKPVLPDTLDKQIETLELGPDLVDVIRDRFKDVTVEEVSVVVPNPEGYAAVGWTPELRAEYESLSPKLYTRRKKEEEEEEKREPVEKILEDSGIDGPEDFEGAHGGPKEGIYGYMNARQRRRDQPERTDALKPIRGRGDSRRKKPATYEDGVYALVDDSKKKNSKKGGLSLSMGKDPDPKDLSEEEADALMEENKYLEHTLDRETLDDSFNILDVPPHLRDTIRKRFDDNPSLNSLGFYTPNPEGFTGPDGNMPDSARAAYNNLPFRTGNPVLKEKSPKQRPDKKPKVFNDKKKFQINWPSLPKVNNPFTPNAYGYKGRLGRWLQQRRRTERFAPKREQGTQGLKKYFRGTSGLRTVIPQAQQTIGMSPTMAAAGQMPLQTMFTPGAARGPLTPMQAMAQQTISMSPSLAARGEMPTNTSMSPMTASPGDSGGSGFGALGMAGKLLGGAMEVAPIAYNLAQGAKEPEKVQRRFIRAPRMQAQTSDLDLLRSNIDRSTASSRLNMSRRGGDAAGYLANARALQRNASDAMGQVAVRDADRMQQVGNANAAAQVQAMNQNLGLANQYDDQNRQLAAANRNMTAAGLGQMSQMSQRNRLQGSQMSADEQARRVEAAKLIFGSQAFAGLNPSALASVFEFMGFPAPEGNWNIYDRPL